MRQTRFARGCAAVSVALPLCLLVGSHRVDGLFSVFPLLLFAAITATLYFAGGTAQRVRARRRWRDAFTRGLAHLQSYRGEAEPRAWLSSIALNICRHILRDRKNEAELAGTEKLEHGVRVRRPRSGGVLTRAIRKEENHLLTVALG